MNKPLLNLSIVAGLGLAGQAFAHEGPSVNEAYVGDSRSHVVIDGAGNCVRTSSWAADKMLVGCGAEPAAEPVVEAAPAPAPKVVTERISMSAAALFDVNKDVIKPAGKAELDTFAARLGSLASVQAVNIVGHTDSSGSDAYNQDLSMRRANAVKNYLIEKGIDPSVMSTSGMGESQPVASNATPEGRAQNRRVEVSFTGTQKAE